MEELMLRIENVSKQYVLGQIGGTTLRDELQRWNAKILGREDPTRRIGAANYNRGETFLALDGVSFDVKKGERVGIIGHNGAGKSTLLKLISRVTAPTGGRIGMNGRVASMLEVGTGFHGELTGRENIYMNGAILGMKKKEIDAKMEDIIEFSEVRQFIDTPVKRYSSGMYVKLAFSVAAHLDSEIMIMDEVLAVGDMAFQKKCLDKMNEVSRKDGRTILYVSHNMNTIRQLCDRCLVLDKGRVAFDGNVEEAIKHYFDKGNTNFPCVYDMLNLPRQIIGQGEKIRISRVAILDKDEAVFYSGEKIKIAVFWRTTIDIDNLRLYFVFGSANRGSIGIMQSDACMNASAGEEYQSVFELDVDQLFAGEYYLVIEMYQLTENSVPIKYDHPECRIHFKIIDELYSGIPWVQGYGQIKMSAIKCLKSIQIRPGG